MGMSLLKCENLVKIATFHQLFILHGQKNTPIHRYRWN